MTIYPLPENPNAIDIIERSIIAHPSLFRESMINQAEMHEDYSRLTHSKDAKQAAINMCQDCLIIYDTIGDDDQTARERAEGICLEISKMVIALNVACKLQCLPNHIRNEALEHMESIK